MINHPKKVSLTLEPGIPEVKRSLDETLLILSPTKDLVAGHVGDNPESVLIEVT